MKFSFSARFVIMAAAVFALISTGAPAVAAGETVCGTLRNGVYEISTVAQLHCLATGDADVRGPGRVYSQTVNLDLGSLTSWEPIGSSDSPFYGRYDGLNHKISNLTISVDTTGMVENVGLFGYVDAYADPVTGTPVANTGVITNLALDTANVAVKTDSPIYFVGALAGYVGTTSRYGAPA